MAYTPEEREQVKKIIDMYKKMTPEERVNYICFGMGLTFQTKKEAN